LTSNTFVSLSVLVLGPGNVKCHHSLLTTHMCPCWPRIASTVRGN